MGDGSRFAPASRSVRSTWRGRDLLRAESSKRDLEGGGEWRFAGCRGDHARCRGRRALEWPVFSADGGTLLFTVNSNSADFDAAAVSLLTLTTNDRQTVRTGGGVFALTVRGELLFVRRRAAMGAQYADGRLSPPELLQVGAAIKASSGGNCGVVGLSPSGTLAFVRRLTSSAVRSSGSRRTAPSPMRASDSASSTR